VSREQLYVHDNNEKGETVKVIYGISKRMDKNYERGRRYDEHF